MTAPPNVLPTKRCYKCRAHKPSAGFLSDRTHADGLQYACSTCSTLPAVPGVLSWRDWGKSAETAGKPEAPWHARLYPDIQRAASRAIGDSPGIDLDAMTQEIVYQILVAGDQSRRCDAEILGLAKIKLVRAVRAERMAQNGERPTSGYTSDDIGLALAYRCGQQERETLPFDPEILNPHIDAALTRTDREGKLAFKESHRQIISERHSVGGTWLEIARRLDIGKDAAEKRYMRAVGLLGEMVGESVGRGLAGKTEGIGARKVMSNARAQWLTAAECRHDAR